MSDDDLIRRGDAVAKANDGVLKYLTEEFETPPEAYIREAIAALPAADPLADPRVRAMIMAERDRCGRIVQAARFGKIDGDFRCISAWIDSGDQMLWNADLGEYETDDERAALTAIQEAKP